MGRIPAAPDEIHPSWLTAALAERHAGARVASVEIAERHEVTNAHARLRIRYEADVGLPEWMFCKMLPTTPERRRAIALTGMGVREALFYERLAPRVAMRVPIAYAARHDERDGSFVLLLEDLEGPGCELPDGTVGVGIDAASAALEDLADLHLRFADPERRRAEAGWVPPPVFDPSYAAMLLSHGLRNHRDRFNDAFTAIAQLYVAEPRALHALWEQGPDTVVHGDPHLGNLFLDRGRLGFLDWGLVSVGNPLRDVSYFIAMSLSIEDRRKHERALLRHYLDWCRANGRAWASLDEAWRTHRVHAAYAVVASCQIAAFPEKAWQRRRAFSDAYLARAQAAVEDLDALGALRECGVRT
jgi:Phosphotransferase enzyme family